MSIDARLVWVNYELDSTPLFKVQCAPQVNGGDHLEDGVVMMSTDYGYHGPLYLVVDEGRITKNPAKGSTILTKTFDYNRGMNF